MWQYIPTEELYHHGILGQKWGVRRYQNKDGTLTAKGKKRLASLEAEKELLSGEKKKSASATSQTQTQTKTTSTPSNSEAAKAIAGRKRVEEMSDSELKTVASRIENAKKYEDYVKSHSNDKLASLSARKEALQLQVDIRALEAKLNPKRDTMAKTFANKLKDDLAKGAAEVLASNVKNAVDNFIKNSMKRASKK